MNRRWLWIGVLVCFGMLVVWSGEIGERSSSSRGAAEPLVPSAAPQGNVPVSLEPPRSPDPVPAERKEVAPVEVHAKSRAAKNEAHLPPNLLGHVVDDQGRPVSGVSVTATPAADKGARGFRAADSKSAEDGSFRINALQPGQWELTAQGRGDLRSSPVLFTAPDEHANPILVLPRGAILAGIVVDATGRALADAEVYLGHAGEELALFADRNSRSARARTDELGRFRIEDVLPGTVELIASSSEHAESDPLGVTVSPGETRDDLRIELGGGRIEGSIDPSLGEIAHRRINLYSFRGDVGWRDTETDERGRFVIESVIPQDYVIELTQTTRSEETVAGADANVLDLHVQMSTTSSQIRKNIKVETGRTTEVVFGAPTRSILVRGTITSHGQPIPEADVQASPKGNNEDTGAKAKSGLDGRYELSVPGAGDYWFSVSLNYGSYADFERKVPDQDEIELSFEVPSGVIAGRVVDDKGRPLEHVPISLTRPGSSKDWDSFFRNDYRRMYTESDGTFAFRLLTPGSYTLRAPDGFQDDSPPPRVAFGRAVLADLVIDENTELADLELRLPPEGRISGVVVDAQGNGASDVSIRVKDARGLSLSGSWETHTDATGHFMVDNVGPGSYTVAARTSEAEVLGPPVQVEAGQTASTRIELR